MREMPLEVATFSFHPEQLLGDVKRAEGNIFGLLSQG